MKVGFIRKAPGYPVETQRQALVDFGCQKVFGPEEDRDDLIQAGLRKLGADTLVLFSLHLFGTSRQDLQDGLELAATRRVKIVDLSHPRLVATAELAAWITDALRKVTGERRRPSKAASARGGRKRKGRVKERELSRSELHAIWFDKAILTNDDAAIAAGTPKRSLYRLFGASGRPAGWPGKRS